MEAVTMVVGEWVVVRMEAVRVAAARVVAVMAMDDVVEEGMVVGGEEVNKAVVVTALAVKEEEMVAVSQGVVENEAGAMVAAKWETVVMEAAMAEPRMASLSQA